MASMGGRQQALVVVVTLAGFELAFAEGGVPVGESAQAPHEGRVRGRIGV
jgi:hypothetical protein